MADELELRLDSLAGVGPVTTRKLNDAGVHSIMDLIVRGPVEVAELTGMDIDTAAKLVEKAREGLVEGGLIAKDFVSASELYKKRQNIGKITTGTDCLDTLFDGGVDTSINRGLWRIWMWKNSILSHNVCPGTKTKGRRWTRGWSTIHG